MRPCFLLAALVLVAACDTAEPNPPDPPDPVYDPPTAIDESTLVTETTEAALAQRRAQWNADDPDDYRFEVYRLCVCLENRVRYVVTVRGGQAREATRTTPHDSVTVAVAPAAVPYPTVGAIFDAIQDGFDQDADELEARYRDSDGLPARVFIDPEAGRTDDELHLYVAGFDAL